MKKKYKNTYEDLLDFAEKEGIYLTELPDFVSRNKGLYSDGVIGLSKDLRTTAEKASVLAEEIGHYKTSYGNILDQTSVANRKQEYQARAWGFNLSIGLQGILDCYLAHCSNLYEMADYLNVTEDYLMEALSHFRQKYGTHVAYDNYVIYFEPNLGVLESK